jgi:tetratricopeptide (TPR) repeat protein
LGSSGISSADAGRLRALAAEAGPQLATDPLPWQEKLAEQHDRLADAVRWFVDAGDPAAAVAMVADLHPYFRAVRHDTVARELTLAAVELPGAADVPRYAEARAGLARLVFSSGRPAGQAYADALAAASSAGDAALEVECLTGLARVAAREERWDEVREHGLAGLRAAEHTPPGPHRRGPVHVLAAAARMTGDYAEARARYAESIAIAESLGLVAAVPSEQHNLGYVELHSGDLDAAERLFRQAVDGARRTGAEWLLPLAVLDFGVLAVAKGRLERGMVLVVAAKAAVDRTGTAFDPDDDAEYRAAVRALAERVDGGQLANWTRRGRGLSLADAVTLATGSGQAA